MKLSLADFNLKTKNKKAKNTDSDESDCDGPDISFQESSTSITDEDETEHEYFEMNRSQLTVDVIPENIKDDSFILCQSVLALRSMSATRIYYAAPSRRSLSLVKQLCRLLATPSARSAMTSTADNPASASTYVAEERGSPYSPDYRVFFTDPCDFVRV
ncbi:jg2842 [Pararge aegeria aegeria]|uniref:Jg2842 protein n=1 Tax=Pararge aegeria aegeria TaxID=348720 RepID=A0A8S4QSH4_9NEOP|nr:jg2842 [Pararge aegeria aegeria]